MYIRQLFAQKPCVFSMEVFPPKQLLYARLVKFSLSIPRVQLLAT